MCIFWPELQALHSTCFQWGTFCTTNVHPDTVRPRVARGLSKWSCLVDKKLPLKMMGLQQRRGITGYLVNSFHGRAQIFQKIMGKEGPGEIA